MVDEDGVVGAAPLRLRLGRHVHGVARRLHSSEEPRHLGSRAEERGEAAAARAGVLDPGRDGADERQPTGVAASRPAVQRKRRTTSGSAAAASAASASSRELVARSGAIPIRADEASSRSRCASSRKGRPPIRAASRRRPPAQQSLVVRVEDGRVGVDEAAPRHGQGQQGHRVLR